MVVPVFVINLKSSAERRRLTTEQLAKAGITPHIIEAVEGVDLTNEEIRNNPNFGLYKTFLHSRYLLKQEIGCFMSHMKIYRKIVDENIPCACILEDDAIFSDAFGFLIKSEEVCMDEWDILYAGHHSGSSKRGIKAFRNKIINGSGVFVGEPLEPVFGSFGYFIKKEAAVLLLANAFPINKPFDSYLGSSNRIGLKIRILTPNCILHNYNLSSTVYNNSHFNYVDHSNHTGKIIRELYTKLVIFRKARLALFKLKASIIRLLIRTQIIKNTYS